MKGTKNHRMYTAQGGKKVEPKPLEKPFVINQDFGHDLQESIALSMGHLTRKPESLRTFNGGPEMHPVAAAATI